MAKKIIRLTESQLIDIIKKTIKEESEKRPHDKMVRECLTKAGWKSNETNGKYDLYMTTTVRGITYIVTSQEDPTKFATNNVTKGKVTGRGEFQIGTTTNCDTIIQSALSGK